MKVLKIWKFEVGHVGTVTMPRGASLMQVGLQLGGAVVWAAVDVEAPRVLRRIWIAETGDDWPLEARAYLGTLQHLNGRVEHVFDLGEVTHG